MEMVTLLHEHLSTDRQQYERKASGFDFLCSWEYLFFSPCGLGGKSMKHFCPGGRGLLQDDPIPIARTQGLTEWFDEVENGLSEEQCSSLKCSS